MRRRDVVVVSGVRNSFSSQMSMACCTICAAQDNQRTGLVSLSLFPVWDTLLPILGVNFNLNLESISSLPLCSLCHASLGRIVELKQELDRLALELTTRVEAVRRLVQESVGGQFVHSATQLRGQILVAGGNGATCFSQNSGQGQSVSAAQCVVPSTYQEQTSGGLGGGGGGRDKIHPLFFFDPEPQEAVPFNNQGQYFVLASTTQQPAVVSQEKNTNLTRSTNNMEEANESSNSNDADEDYFPPSQQEDHQIFRPPRLKRGKSGRPGRLTEEQKANMLEKRKLTEVEQFSPVVKTNDGRRFYEGHEIRSSTTSPDKLQCGTCEWTETNDGSYPWLRIRSMKVHIKAKHLDAYKCKLCNRNLSCLKSLRSHEMMGYCTEKVRREPSYQCDGCNAKFTFPHNLRKHKRVLKCGDLSVAPATLAISTSAIKGTPCPICGRPINYTSLKSHLWTHKNSHEKAEAIAAGQRTRNMNKSQCPQCGKIISRKGFRRHISTHEDSHRSQITITQRRVKCKFCQQYLSAKSIKRHVRVIHERSGGNLHKYPEPRSENQTFTTKADVAVLKQGNICNICNAYWTYSSDLTAHLADHAKQKHTAEMFSFVCSVAECGVRFTTKLTLESHLKRMHPETRPTQNAEEEKNMTIEQPDKFDCGIEIRSKGKHKRREQLPSFEKVDGNGNLSFMSFEVVQDGEGYTCVTCGAEFKYENNEDDREIIIKRRAVMNVKRHIIRVHRDDYKCLICGHVAISTLRLQQHERRHVIREPLRCDICGDPFCNFVTRDHRWIHLGVTEMVAAINLGEMIPPYFLNKARRQSLAYWEEHDIPINCDHCNHPKFPNAVSLYHHISDQHPNVAEHFPKENARNQDSGLQPTLQLPRILSELRNGTKVLLISGKVVATFSKDGKEILLSDNAEITIKDELDDEACGVVIPDVLSHDSCDPSLG